MKMDVAIILLDRIQARHLLESCNKAGLRAEIVNTATSKKIIALQPFVVVLDSRMPLSDLKELCNSLRSGVIQTFVLLSQQSRISDFIDIGAAHVDSPVSPDHCEIVEVIQDQIRIAKAYRYCQDFRKRHGR